LPVRGCESVSCPSILRTAYDASPFAGRHVGCYYTVKYFVSLNDPPPTEIYTLSLHDALPISRSSRPTPRCTTAPCWCAAIASSRSEEHTSELQSPDDPVCRLLLEKKIRSDADAKFLACLVRFESYAVATSFPTAYDV